MFCSKCAKELPVEAVFCIQCGQPVNPKKKENVSQWTLAIMGAGFGVVAILFAVLQATRSTVPAKDDPPIKLLASGLPSPSQSPTPAPISKSTPKPIMKPIEAYPVGRPDPEIPPASLAVESIGALRILGDTLVIKPGQYYKFPLKTDPTWTGQSLSGSFEAISGDNVEVSVTDDEGLINFEHGSPYRTWYRSGRITAETVKVPLPSQQTYLILSNRYSVISTKVVKANFTLYYKYTSNP